MATGSPFLMMCIFLMALLYLPLLVVNYLASSSVGKAFFVNTTEEISDKYTIEITPAKWTFTIWPFLYAWQAVWLMYVVASTCRHSRGEPLYSTFELITPTFCLLMILNWAANVGWLILWDREYVSWSLLALSVTTFTVFLALIASHIQLNNYGEWMMERGLSTDIVSTRAFVQNGLAAYGAWVVIATLLNMVVMLTYRMELSNATSSTIAIGILAGVILTSFILESTLLDRWLRYTCSQYIVFLVALTGIVQNNWEDGALNSILIVALLALTEMLTVAKVILMLTRQRSRPIFKINIKATSFYPRYYHRENSVFYL